MVLMDNLYFICWKV